MFCIHCGAQIKPGNKFCTVCGKSRTAKVDSPKSEDEVSKQPDIPNSSQTAKNDGIELNDSRRGWWIAGIIGVVIIVIIIILSSFNHGGGITSQQSSNSQNNSQSVVDIWCDNNQGGSGTIFTTDGTVLTNNHVITGATICQVTIPDPATGGIAEIYDAAPVITPTLSQQYDIATLKIDGSYTDASGTTWGTYPTTFTPFTLPSTCNTSTPSQLGDSVRIYGYPVTSGGLNLTVTDGVISSFADDGDILTSAKVDSGNSGGLAVDQSGCWLGIPSAVVSGNYQNLGVIIPGSIVEEDFLNSVPAKYEPIAVSSSTDNSPSPSTATTPQETNDQICQSSFGTYSEWSGKTNSNSQPTCDCQTGYSWDGSGNACTTQISLQQSCQDQYGSGSYSYPQNGKAVCGCSSGYTWNSGQTACVQESNGQICQDNYGAYSVWNGQINGQGGPTCDCERVIRGILVKLRA